MVLALAVRHEKSVTSWQAAGLIVGFAGAVLIFTPWATVGGLFSAGGMECLVASISYAVSYIYMDKFLARLVLCLGMEELTDNGCIDRRRTSRRLKGYIEPLAGG